jgi:hypothetical protein
MQGRWRSGGYRTVAGGLWRRPERCWRMARWRQRRQSPRWGSGWRRCRCRPARCVYPCFTCLLQHTGQALWGITGIDCSGRPGQLPRRARICFDRTMLVADDMLCAQS